MPAITKAMAVTAVPRVNEGGGSWSVHYLTSVELAGPFASADPDMRELRWADYYVTAAAFTRCPCECGPETACEPVASEWTEEATKCAATN